MTNTNDKYQVATNLFIHEGQVQWNRFGVMLAVNTIFITAIGLIISNKIIFYYANILPILGILLCISWFIMTWKGFDWIEFWATKANEIEKSISRNDKVNPFIDGDRKRKDQNDVLKIFANTAYVSYFVIIIMVILYIIMLVNIQHLQNSKSSIVPRFQIRTMRNLY